ncbi:kinesin-like protein KIF26B, partial [Osmerus eperlanus]|uniref:kinesin-like protein KIF26B n=1 Tax=Osmerus eperlanus TaxID=29151 RepID=UPI002E0D5607
SSNSFRNVLNVPTFRLGVAGTQRRRLIPSLTLDASSSVSSPARKPAASPGARWVTDPPAGRQSPSRSRCTRIDDVERLQRRREKGTKEVMYLSATLQLLEHRQQRISEVRARYDWLKKELEQTKLYLMLEPDKWTSEFDLQPCTSWTLWSYLDALEVVTRRLQTRVNFCKAHLMMVTCFDVACRRR